MLSSGYRTLSLLSVGEKAESSEIIKELLCEENLDDDYQLYELLSKREDLSTGMQRCPFFNKEIDLRHAPTALHTDPRAHQS